VSLDAAKLFRHLYQIAAYAEKKLTMQHKSKTITDKATTEVRKKEKKKAPSDDQSADLL